MSLDPLGLFWLELALNMFVEDIDELWRSKRVYSVCYFLQKHWRKYFPIYIYIDSVNY